MSVTRAAFCAVALIACTASAQDTSELIGLINAYRNAPQTCEGKRTAVAGPLASNPLLAGVQIAAGGQLLDAMKQRGYQAAQAQVITVTGPASASAVLEFMKPRYCGHLLSTRYAEIGIAREANTWRVLLARPLLSPGLGDWRDAGNEILRRTNAARAQPRTCGNQRFPAARPLAWVERLAAAALVHSRDMANQNAFRHAGKDGSEAGDRATKEGYAWQRIGENIAAGQGSAEQVVSAWLSSPPHCANVMNGEFAEMGAAYALNPASDASIYWTQVFGTPR